MLQMRSEKSLEARKLRQLVMRPTAVVIVTWQVVAWGSAAEQRVSTWSAVCRLCKLVCHCAAEREALVTAPQSYAHQRE